MSKWQAGSPPPGPRQAKEFNQAVARLSREANTHVEITGVVGGAEHRSTYWVPIGGANREDVAAAQQAIGTKWDWTVTKANFREIIADFDAAAKEAAENRPVDDKRRSQAEDAELARKRQEREQAEQAREAEAQAIRQQAVAKAPSWAKALIVAELKEDRSDPMSDYHANTTVRCVAIGFRSGNREDFRQLRAAAERFLPGTEWEERRDNYSMGQGNYLSDHGWDGAGSGWVVKSTSLTGSWPRITEDAIPEPGSQPEGQGVTVSADGVTFRPGRRPGVIEVQFAVKPPDEVREAIGRKGAGFRFTFQGGGCWYGYRDAYERAVAAGAPLPALPESTEQREEVGASA